MNKSFFVMVFLGFLYAVLTGRTQEAAQSVISAGGEALETVLGLCGAFMLFGGISRVIEKSGVSGKAVTILKRPLLTWNVSAISSALTRLSERAAPETPGLL